MKFSFCSFIFLLVVGGGAGLLAQQAPPTSATMPINSIAEVAHYLPNSNEYALYWQKQLWMAQIQNMQFYKMNPVMAKNAAQVPAREARYIRVTQATPLRPTTNEGVAKLLEKAEGKLPKDKINCVDCTLAAAGLEKSIDNAGYPETGIKQPLRVPNPGLPSQKHLAMCSRKGIAAYEVFVEHAKGQSCAETKARVHGFKFQGKNSNRERWWEYHFENNSTQDMHITINDNVDGRFSTERKSQIYFFPRKQIPNVQIKGEEMWVTLPTGELVVYNKNTRAIIRGALSEKPSGGKGAGVSYNGTGVTLRLDGRNIEDLRYKKAGAAPIIMKGNQACKRKIRIEELFPVQSDSSNFNFKFVKDEDFDKFLQENCGFGLN